LPDSPNRAEKYLRDRFGVDTGEINLEKINGDYWLCSEEKSGLETETRGIRAVRDMDIGLKPTTYLLQLIQHQINENVAEVSKEDLKAFQREEMIQREMNEKGYVALKFNDRVIGCGFYMGDLISNRIPEGRLKELVESF